MSHAKKNLTPYKVEGLRIISAGYDKIKKTEAEYERKLRRKLKNMGVRFDKPGIKRIFK